MAAVQVPYLQVIPLKFYLKFIYSEKATKFWEVVTLLLFYVVPVKSKLKISQNFVAFSEYMNFMLEILSFFKYFKQWQPSFAMLTAKLCCD